MHLTDLFWDCPWRESGDGSLGVRVWMFKISQVTWDRLQAVVWLLQCGNFCFAVILLLLMLVPDSCNVKSLPREEANLEHLNRGLVSLSDLSGLWDYKALKVEGTGKSPLAWALPFWLQIPFYLQDEIKFRFPSPREAECFQWLTYLLPKPWK